LITELFWGRRPKNSCTPPRQHNLSESFVKFGSKASRYTACKEAEMTLTELADKGLRGEKLAAAVDEDILGLSRVRPAAERTPEERRASLEDFFALMNSFTDEELAGNPLAGRPLNVSILAEEQSSDASAA
jgi:hypothetical protein